MKPKVFLLILDGYGLRDDPHGNAVRIAETPFLKTMLERWNWTRLSASGRDVGLPKGQMGNSEVGHLNLGAGRIVFQDITRIDHSIETGEFYDKPALRFASDYAGRNGAALHLMGLVSDGGVHSSLEHLFALLEFARRRAMKKVFLHVFTDGRDTSPHAGVNFVRRVEAQMHQLKTGRIATVCGRYYAMDRDKRWERTEKAWSLLSGGEGNAVASAEGALVHSYRRGVTDEFVEPSVIMEDGHPVGVVHPGDAVIFFNFRADRARQICRALADPAFDGFPRRPLDIALATMTRYQEDFNFPVVFPPRSLDSILGSVLAESNKRQFRIAETEKYAHITYFFNGGDEPPFSGEDRALVASPKVATYDLQPEMSAQGVSDRAIEAFEENYDFILLNFANPDMVGHTGILSAAVKALEALDPLVNRLVERAMERGYTTFVTADHGNCEQMIDDDGGPHTAHTTNLVPFVVIPPFEGRIQLRPSGVLADVAPTVLRVLGIPQPPQMEGQCLIL
ncbi:MAG: 2,3-bisphosphoglycerate-independent phosphoglycerate mutase [Calditrichaeota bacterium]|nr:2,3-bisphosphoglycerate-independent phosphoglycerate mutase [Calditrichota bacterium]